MAVHDLWKGLSPTEVERRRAKDAVRYQRRWREGTGREAVQRKQSYPASQRSQAYIDDAKQRSSSSSTRRPGNVTVNVLLDRHLATRSDRAPQTVKDYYWRSQSIRKTFGYRSVSTLTPTEIETWCSRPGVAAESRKKSLEILRASIKRGIRDKLITEDPTVGIVVPLGHRERPHWSSTELVAVLDATTTNFDYVLLGVQGLMGLRSGEALGLKVGSLDNGILTVRNSGADSDTTKTRAGTRRLPVPPSLLPRLLKLIEGRAPDAWVFESPRKRGWPVGKGYVLSTLDRAIEHANTGREHQITRINVHGLRHTFAAITLGEIGADVVAVSRALGHSRPSTTLNHYGHLAPAGLENLMERIGALGNPSDP